MKKIIYLAALMASAFAAPLHAQTAEDIFRKVFDNGEDYEIDEIGHVSAYAFYDVDGDGVSECFLRGEDDSYCMYCCGDNNGKPNEKALTMSLNSIFKTHLSIMKGKPYICVQGSCGTGCYQDSYAKITKSHIEYNFDCISLYGPDDESEFECTKHVPGNELKNITKAEFDKLVPDYTPMSMNDLHWINRKMPLMTSALKTVNATLHSQIGDTIILKDSNGYFYQIMAEGKVGVAPGGAYSGDLTFPSSISYEGNTYTVTTVRRGALWKKADAKNIGTITSVTLPESVTLVGADAFRDNPMLATVNYGKNTRIEVRSFWGCPKLKLREHPICFAYTDPEFRRQDETIDQSKFATFYYPTDEPSEAVKEYQWAVFKHNHNAISFSKWMNMKKENAMACKCYNLKAVRAGVFELKDPTNVSTMFKGNMEYDQEILLAHNNYVATHEFVMFSRYNWGEDIKSMPQSYIQSMAKKYGRKVKYSNEVARTLYSSNPEKLVITEFAITNHEAMLVLSWIRDNKEVCSFVKKQKTDPEYEEYSIWNVDDDGDYGIPSVISITKDEKGNIELFLNHSAPESTNLMRLVQRGNKLVLEETEAWYNWIDAPDE